MQIRNTNPDDALETKIKEHRVGLMKHHFLVVFFCLAIDININISILSYVCFMFLGLYNVQTIKTLFTCLVRISQYVVLFNMFL